MYSIHAMTWLYSVQYMYHVVTVHYYWARVDCTLLLSSSWLYTITELDVTVYYYWARSDCTLLLSLTWLYSITVLDVTVHYYWGRRDCTLWLSSTWLYTTTEHDLTVHYAGVRGWRHILPSAYVPYICWSYGDRKCNSWRGFYHF